MKLEKYLEENGIIKKWFAEKTGITANTLANILANKYLPNLKTAISIEMITDGEVSVYDWIENPDQSENGQIK